MTHEPITTITIASKSRPSILDNCIASILQTKNQVKVEVLVSNLHEDLPEHLNPHRDDKANNFLVGNHIHITEDADMKAVEAQNFLIRTTQSDFYLPLSDDVQLYPDTLDIALKCLLDNFPNGDGAVGLKTDNIEHASDSCFLLMGNQFVERFSFRSPFCPEYVHFYADTELGLFAKKLGLFKFCEEAKLIHFHTQTCNDETHRGAKQFWPFDHKKFEERQAKEELWGLSKL